MKKPIFVINAINIFQGGTLSICRDCFSTIREMNLGADFEIIVFVHKKELFSDYKGIATFIELPKSRKSYAYRLYYEYFYFYQYSKRMEIDVWLSLEDVTPKVHAKKQYTYCHNPLPFLKKDISKFKYSLKGVMWQYFFKYIYQLNIKSATAVIVQQDWLRHEFLKMFPVKNVIVAKPNISADFNVEDKSIKGKTVFIYAAYPRFFKNFEIICEASNALNESDSSLDYEVWFTIDGNENKYSSDIYKKYSSNPKIRWLGLKKREEIFDLYNRSKALIFPSKIETWGLPISEFKMTGKDIILADEPYAYETLGTYDKCMFFDEDDRYVLAQKMKDIIHGQKNYQSVVERKITEPYAKNWCELLSMLLQSK